MAKPLEYWRIGAVAALFSGVVLGFISNIVSMIPGITLDLQAITIGTTGLGGIINPGMSKYAQKLFGLVPVSLSGMDWVLLAVGGAASLVLGAWVVENVKQLQFAKTTQGKLATIFVVAGIATGWVLSMSIGIPALSGIVVMAINALILSYIWIWLGKQLGIKLIP